MVTSTESRTKFSDLLTDAEELRAEVEIVVNSTPVMDAHTHLFPPEFNELCLDGIDELLTYHYLTAETFRSARFEAAPAPNLMVRWHADGGHAGRADLLQRVIDFGPF